MRLVVLYRKDVENCESSEEPNSRATLKHSRPEPNRMTLTCGSKQTKRWFIVFFALCAALSFNTQVFDLQTSTEIASEVVKPIVEDISTQAVGSTIVVDSKSTSPIRDPQSWETPRIVVLAGPHKTGSTSLQKFLVHIAGKTYVTGKNTYNASQHFVVPHDSNTEWVWPTGLYHEYFLEKRLLYAFGPKDPPDLEKRLVTYLQQFNSKFYSAMIPLIVDWNMPIRWPRWMDNTTNVAQEAVRADVADYFRTIFRLSWEEGRKIVFGAEAFDFLTIELNGLDVEGGEATHVAPHASEKLQRLLDLFPWDNTFHSQTPLRLEDIEVQLSLRSPRFSHVVSLWHQTVSTKPVFEGLTLREFIIYVLHWDFNVIDTLGLALQFARKGVRTTIIDMLGVTEHEEKYPTRKTKQGRYRVVGGMQGVMACDILQVETNTTNRDKNLMWCDENSKLYVPNFEAKKLGVFNSREDPAPRDLTEEQIEELEQALVQYDCSVWQHLQKYEEQGMLRILYKTKDLFATCDPEGSEDISVFRFTDKTEEIARQENGIPLREIPNTNFHKWYKTHQKPFDMVGDCLH